MSAYLIPIKSEVIAFPFIALFVSLPFMVGQYRKYGSFLFWRAVVLYSFVFYLLAAYFMIMLPLPSRASVAALTTPRYNLVPFSALRTFLATTVFSPFHPGTWLVALRQPGFIQPAFNLVLTLPFGVYLRYYFKRSLPQVMVMTFGLSLFFELTQLSGLYGIYPRPYRLFDVDDLIINTTGGVLGGLLAPALMRAFPTREEMDRKSYAQGARVTWLRRFVAFVIDNVVGVGLTVLVMTLLARLFDLTSPLLTWLINAVFAPLVVFVLSPLLAGGATLGKRLVRIRVVCEDGRPVGFWRLLYREFLLYGFAKYVVVGLNAVFAELFSKFHRTDLNWALFALLLAAFLFLLANFIWEVITRDNHYFYDVWARTKQVSTASRKAQTKATD
ncbi:VanZ family protein [Lacticaseibacillus camelliae]|uniref:Glycopeptide antibiotics resistance protein n=1 Tax=Lacticaseibacillus camelliae DSM 22697 = JCM 13995 TaxID=1423730 RepID=A0A0R2FEV0_9LACO|nr:VanZ family protein [Lacticaseibacillus camelliae]KRN25931.1 glycopeptide antibiotics resistance protein [Lacticaseibacillus camelliae DSM 22697 = JCM 13995]